jgi:hypothetical protein
MNKTIIGFLVAAIVGGGAFFMMKGDNTSDTASIASLASNVAQQSKTAKFAPENTTNSPFTAVMSSTGSGVDGMKGTLKSDGMGNVHFTGMIGTQNTEFYILKDGSNIFCTAGNCFSSNVATGTQSAAEFNVTDEDIVSYQDKATQLGEESCPTGKCTVWQIADGEEDTKIYIDNSTNRVSKVSGKLSGDTFEMIYTYEPVTITIPTNVQTIPTVPVQ